MILKTKWNYSSDGHNAILNPQTKVWWPAREKSGWKVQAKYVDGGTTIGWIRINHKSFKSILIRLTRLNWGGRGQWKSQRLSSSTPLKWKVSVLREEIHISGLGKCDSTPSANLFLCWWKSIGSCSVQITASFSYLSLCSVRTDESATRKQKIYLRWILWNLMQRGLWKPFINMTETKDCNAQDTQIGTWNWYFGDGVGGSPLFETLIANTVSVCGVTLMRFVQLKKVLGSA